MKFCVRYKDCCVGCSMDFYALRLMGLRGQPLHGSSGTARNLAKRYYYKNTRISLSADLVEAEAKKMVCEVITKSPVVQQAIFKRSAAVNENIEAIKKILQEKSVEKENLDKQLKTHYRLVDFYLDQGKENDSNVRQQFAEEHSAITSDINAVNTTIANLQRDIKTVEANSFDWTTIDRRAEEILTALQAKNLQGLRELYGTIFKKIVVGNENDNGVRDLKFILKDSAAVIAEETLCKIEKLGRSSAL